MSHELSKKSFHIDLSRKTKHQRTKHPYNLRPRRKQPNYNEKNFKNSIQHKRSKLQNDIQIIDITDSSSSKQSSRTSLNEPAEILTHFVNENYGVDSVDDLKRHELGENDNSLELSSHNNEKDPENQSVETVLELDPLENIEIDGGAIEQSSENEEDEGVASSNDLEECIDNEESEEDVEAESTNDLEQGVENEEHASEELNPYDVNEDDHFDFESIEGNEENLTDNDSADVSRAMGDGRHNRPHFIELEIYMTPDFVDNDDLDGNEEM
ncbi:DNA polymerase epsilon subunit 2-like [Eupeodes corollae]|uniref:DNA polymerase epsilon subunit 2-like n=1 Tax=Eupeodes corollae TaxID=290404 RepID=UPI002493CE2A|nr:DNA polymerase epsilon subunit 2-like [Eupeodes corollae]